MITPNTQTIPDSQLNDIIEGMIATVGLYHHDKGHPSRMCISRTTAGAAEGGFWDMVTPSLRSILGYHPDFAPSDALIGYIKDQGLLDGHEPSTIGDRYLLRIYRPNYDDVDHLEIMYQSAIGRRYLGALSSDQSERLAQGIKDAVDAVASRNRRVGLR